MPFLGQDWRSPGEQWVRTTEGWERLGMWRLKLLENLNENVIARLLKMAGSDCYIMRREGIGCFTSQPYVHITRGNTKESKVQTSISEAFNRLDMTGAVKDIRRFNYVAKLVELLVRNKMNTLSGTAQKLLFNILDEMVVRVSKTQMNMALMEQLLNDVHDSLIEGHYYHVGSGSLWRHHSDMVARMRRTLEQTKIKQREEDGKLKLSDLPDDCIREILLCLTDHKDIVHTGQTETRSNDLSKECQLWRNLCLFHFDNKQINTVMKKNESLGNMNTDQWKILFNRLTKRFGRRDSFAETLSLCKHCNALFWTDHGHPCLLPNAKPMYAVLSPAMCIELFST